MEKLHSIFSDRFLSILGGIILISILFFPVIKLSPSLPSLEFIDFIIPLIGIIVLLKWKEIPKKRFHFLLIGFGLFILLTIIINGRTGSLRDYFEIYKILKFALIIALFSLINAEKFLKKWVVPAFIVLVILNIAHYYNIFNFNTFLAKFYLGGERIAVFGLDSFGYPTQKRMLGFTANPNNNAILFMFFATLFMPAYGKKIEPKQLLLFVLALLMIFLCQSRTAILAMAFIVLVYSIPIILKEYKKIGILVGVFGLTFLLSTLIARVSIGVGVSSIEDGGFNDNLSMYYQDSVYTKYTDTLSFQMDENYKGNKKSYTQSLLDGSAFQSNSMSMRLEIWKQLLGMAKKKPIFGHGPNKDFFYKNRLYAESEYVFTIWKYGAIGLISFLALMFFTLKWGYQDRFTQIGIALLLTTLVIGITSLTNNPFSHKTLSIFYAILIGLCFYKFKLTKKED